MRIFHSHPNFRTRAMTTASFVCAAFVGTVAAGGGASHAADDTFKVSRLTLANIVGEVTIDVHNAPTTIVKYTGSKPRDSVVSIAEKNGKLVIRGKSMGKTVTSKSGGKSGTVIIGQSNHVVIGKGASSTVVIGDQVEKVSSGSAPRWKLALVVPKGQELRLRGYIGKLKAGDIEGPLNADVEGATEFSIGAITSGKLKMAGSGSAKLAAVQGDLSIDVQGAADVEVDKGRIGDLKVKIEGAGDVTVNGTAQRAQLTSIGSGDIHVDAVRQKPKTSVIGAGDITIGNE